MTKTQALTALTGDMRLTRKMAAYLLGQAERYGTGAHLKCEVTYTAADGYAIADYRKTRRNG